MSRRFSTDTLIALILMVVWGVLFEQTFHIRKVPYSIMGSEAWPRIVLAMLFVLLILYLIGSLSPRKERSSAESVSTLPWHQVHFATWVCLIAFTIFLFLLPILGLLVSGSLFVTLVLQALGVKTWKRLAIHAVIGFVSVGIMWAIFSYGLGVVLPAGDLWY